MNLQEQQSPPSRQSVWLGGVRLPTYEKLDSDLAADVCVVGAGISGLSTAYIAASAGLKVIVVDDGQIGGGATRDTTAHLANAIDDRFYHLEKLHGSDGARLAAESHTAAIARIAEIAQAEGIACDFSWRSGYLILPPGGDPALLDRELAAAQRAGLAQVEIIPQAPMHDFDSGPCLHFPNQAQFHPLRYLVGLAEAFVRMGGRIYTRSHVDTIQGGNSACAVVGQHRISAGAIVVATNTPINDLFAVHTKQAAYMTYVIAASVPRRLVTPALFWDFDDPYHYVRLQNGDATNDSDAEDLLIIGGEDHRSGQALDGSERHARLEAWARRRFPMMRRVTAAWSGQVMETIDGLAFIGRNPMDKDNVYIVTGDSGMGMTHGTIAGMLLTDLITGKTNPWEKLYDPSRKPIMASVSFADETMNTALQYAEWLTPGDVVNEDDIPIDSGAVVRRGLSKVAVYRDAVGVLHEFSAVCPHLGCIVRWNATEKSWDCPCHGSRFDKLGQVINGPANRKLARVTPEADIAGASKAAKHGSEE